MTYETIEARKVTPVIGAEIAGVDLSRPLSDRQAKEIRAAWMENLVIFFRDQTLTVEQHLAFGRSFGKLHLHPAAHKPDQHPEILVIKADENSKHVAGEEWHTDVSCDAEPPMGSILHMTEVPPDGGGATLFASMYRAYETLSDPIKRMLSQLTAVHDGKHVYERPGYREDRQYPRSEHPIVRTHPVTGRQALFVNRGFTTRIVGMTRSESDAILQMRFIDISRRPSSKSASTGSRVRWPAGTTAAPSTTRCSTTSRTAATDTALTVAGDKPFHRADEPSSASQASPRQAVTA